MGWTEWTPPDLNAVTIANTKPGRGSKYATTVIMIGRATAEALGIKPGVRYQLLIGSDANTGWVQITAAAAGALAVTTTAKSLRFTLRGFPGTPVERHPHAPVQFRAVNAAEGGVEIELPDWLGARPASSAGGGAAKAGPGRPRTVRDITSGVMGDPAPGRSALDQKQAG